MAVKGFHSADAIIKEALVEIQDAEMVNYAEAALYFMKGFRDFELFEAGGQIQEAYRNVSAINTVPFPEDLLRLISVGVLVDSEFFPFTRTDKLRLPSDPLDIALNTDRNEDSTIDRSPTVGYGTKGINVEYYFREDRANRRIVLSRAAVDQTLFADRGEVLIKYVSTGITDYNTTVIADDAANLLGSYVVYKLISARPDKYSMGYMSLKKEEYIENLKMYRALELPSLQELEDLIYETSSQNVRR